MKHQKQRELEWLACWHSWQEVAAYLATCSEVLGCFSCLYGISQCTEFSICIHIGDYICQTLLPKGTENDDMELFQDLKLSVVLILDLYFLVVLLLLFFFAEVSAIWNWKPLSSDILKHIFATLNFLPFSLWINFLWNFLLWCVSKTQVWPIAAFLPALVATLRLRRVHFSTVWFIKSPSILSKYSRFTCTDLRRLKHSRVMAFWVLFNFPLVAAIQGSVKG